MHRLTIIFGLLFLFSIQIARAQSSFQYMTFSQGIKELNSIASDDSMHLLAGYTTYPSQGGTDMWIQALDLDGNQLWSRSYGGSDDDVALDICKSGPSHYVVVGFRNFGIDRQFSFFRIDNNGDIEWSYTYKGANEDVATSVAECQNGDLLIAGYTNSSGPGSTSALIMRMDSSGNPVWMYTIGTDEWQEAHDIIELQNGNIAFTGVTYAVDGVQSDMYSVQLNAAGGLVSSYAVGSLSEERGLGITQNWLGAPVICGWTSGYTIQRHAGNNATVWEVNSAGTLKEFRVMGMYDNETSFKSIESKSVVDRGYVLCGLAGDVIEDNFFAWVVETDSFLTTMKSRTYGEGFYEFGNDISLQGDTGWTLAGYTETYTTSADVYVVSKQDSLDTMCLEHTDSAVMIDTIQSVYNTDDTVMAHQILVADTISWVDAIMPDSLICNGYCAPGDSLLADFEITYLLGEDLMLLFHNKDLNADSIRWDFGDSTSGAGDTVEHTYLTAGVRIVCMYIYSECDSDSVCHLVDLASGVQGGSESLEYEIVQTANFIQIQNMSNEDLNISLYSIDGRERSYLNLPPGAAHQFNDAWMNGQLCLFRIRSNDKVSMEKMLVLFGDR